MIILMKNYVTTPLFFDFLKETVHKELTRIVIHVTGGLLFPPSM